MFERLSFSSLCLLLSIHAHIATAQEIARPPVAVEESDCKALRGPAPFEQSAMPSPPGALAGAGDRPIGSIPLSKGRIAEPGPASEATSLLQQGRYEDAERAFRNLLSELEGRTDPNPRDVAQTLANLAVLFHMQARYEEAARFYRASIEVTNKQWEKTGTPERSQHENRLKTQSIGNRSLCARFAR